jgi:hypothetical protein
LTDAIIQSGGQPNDVARVIARKPFAFLEIALKFPAVIAVFVGKIEIGFQGRLRWLVFALSE